MTAPSSRRATYFGVFTVAMATLMLEILLTRITSVIAWYHLAFFVISLTMLGMTAGAVYVFVRPAGFTDEQVPKRLAQTALGFAVTTPFALAVAMSVPLLPAKGLMDFAALLAFGGALAIPFALGGITLTLALTRAGLPPSTAYGVDLVGAAFGCLAIIPLLDRVDAASAALLSCAIAAVGALAFAHAAGRSRRPAIVAVGVLLAAGIANDRPTSQVAPLRPAWVKGFHEKDDGFAYLGWNTYSRVTVDKTVEAKPYLWAQSPKMPKELKAKIVQRVIRIDGAAATMLALDATDLEAHAYLDYDVTSFAHRLRPHGPAAVIGVGGGRDVIEAVRAGHEEVVGIELNDQIVRLHTEVMADFSRLTELPGVRLASDEARSWLARDDGEYSVITMSLIDTWASTGAGAYSLSENGLYTREAWRGFADRLAPDGIFTVSRWYHAKAAGETARMLALAMEVLWTGGAEDPRRHLILLQYGNVATLLLCKAPFSDVDLDRMQRDAVALGFNTIATPRRVPFNPMLRELWEVPDRDALWKWASSQALDFTPPTDDRPFFFNMLKPSTWLRNPKEVEKLDVSFLGNLQATQTLVYATLVSIALTLLTIVVPLWARRRSLPPIGRKTTLAASAYFALIGLGFMFVEIGLLSRLNVFLGHPTLALAALLGGIILFTGIGSLLSERLDLDRPVVARYFPLVPAALVLVMIIASPSLVRSFIGASTAIRVSAGVFMVAVPALGMGLGFPLGLRLVARAEGKAQAELGPWLWGINGATGVCASGLALGCSMVWGVPVTLAVGGACYVVLLACTRVLART